MEVFETTSNNTQVLVASNWTEDATIAVWGLLPEMNYIISVKAVNERGESSPVYVGGKTVGFIQSLPRAVEESRLPMLFVIVGVLVTLMVLGAFFTAAIAIRKRRRMKKYSEKEVDSAFTAGGLVRASDMNGGHDDEDIDDAEEDEGGFKVVRRHHVVHSGHDTVDATSTPLLDGNGAANNHQIAAGLNNGNGTLNNSRQNLPTSASRRALTPDRKVSFRKEQQQQQHLGLCPNCGGRQQLPPSEVRRSRSSFFNGDLNNGQTSLPRKFHINGLPVERAVVRTFSIEKMRPICPTCNPGGTTPYPSENHALDEIVKQLGQSQTQLQRHQKPSASSATSTTCPSAQSTLRKS